MGCLPKPPKINPPAPEPAPASQGADALGVGSPDDPFNTRSAGAVGRLALRVGRGSGNTSV